MIHTRFLTHRNTCPVNLDVRSPGEYDHARIPGIYFYRYLAMKKEKDVGLWYTRKQEGHQGRSLIIFEIKLRAMVEEAEKIIKEWKKQHPGQ